jgi:hypothetical protein
VTETWNTIDMMMGIVQVGIAWVTKSLMPEQAFGLSMKLVETKFVHNGGTRRFVCLEEQTNSVFRVGGSGGNGLFREKDGVSVAETTTEYTLKVDILRLV